MSSPLAIAAVTYVLKDLLNDGIVNNDISNSVGKVEVTVLPPDRIETGDSEPNRINLFMYMATHNSGWRNEQQPTHSARGERVSYPPLALDLHYLMTVYGSEEMHQDILLGYGMHLMHEIPVLTRNMIRRSIDPPASTFNTLPPHLRSLATSGLADQIEMIKITPETLNTEELSKLWTAFGAKYRPNAAYKVTVVLIQSEKSAKPALPVRQANIYVMPFKQPVLEKISALTSTDVPVAADEKILSGYQLILEGYNLRGIVTKVKISGEIFDVLNPVSDSRIALTIPNSIQAGVHGVQVVHEYSMGSPLAPHSGVSSNMLAMVLSPSISAISVQNPQISSGLIKAKVNFTLTPTVNPAQKIALTLDEINLAPNTQGMRYGFEVRLSELSSPPTPISKIEIPVQRIKPGTYLVRVSVDGIETPVGLGPNGYNAPQITFP
jgi:hypothetical protein